MFVAESLDKAKFSHFVKCLRQTNQNTVARIMENGGGTAKIELQTRGARCTALIESQLLHQRIEDLRSKAKPRSHETDKIISQLKDVGIEILNSRLERQTLFVWIWCRSQTALEYIQNLYESNQLRDYMFFEIIQTLLSTVINIDMNQFKETIVVRAFHVSFVKRIKIQENMFGPRRVTKLRNEIYIGLLVASSSLSVIHVFEDKNPFNWQKKIDVTEIGITDDIISNEKENCLYVTDVLAKCVWKITREEDDGYKFIKWLKIDYLSRSMSVSTDGQLLAINNFSLNLSSPSLMIYGSDAKLIRSIQLPTDFRLPRHVVETSIGNFIILHVWAKDEVDRPRESNGSESVMNSDISEMSKDGQIVIRRFIPSNEKQQLKNPAYFLLDSEDRVFVADSGNDRVILLDSDLKWNRILVPTGEKEESKIHWPNRLYYDEEKKQLIVGGYQLNVCSISRK